MLILLQGMQIRKASQCQPGHSVDSVYSSHERTQSKKKKKKRTQSAEVSQDSKKIQLFLKDSEIIVVVFASYIIPHPIFITSITMFFFSWLLFKGENFINKPWI